MDARDGDLPIPSIGSFIKSYNPETTVRKTSVLSCTDGLVLLYTETIDGAPMYHVGNPFLRQWVRIPLPSHLPGYDFVRLHRKIIFSATLESVTKMERGYCRGL
ncbi:putative F-box protein [Cardamine amara subsp. amara]|uniref:F-box protein n=1 Tax=Cardamine amara subsp. amara TaxID=228776 RepID=A0ABD1B2Q5_CARAN